MSDETSSQHQVCIAGTGSYLPERVLTNADLEKIVETSDEWIFSRTGIRERRIAAEGEFTSHMASKAGAKALEQAGITADQVELIIVATITPDTLTPATACYVQQQLGAFGAVAFDISAACAGFCFGVSLANRNTCVLFGDGAGAAVLRRAAPEEGSILATEMGTDGRLCHLIQIPGGGSALPITPENIGQHLASLTMMGKEVFKHAVNRMKESAEKVIERAGLKPEDIALVVPHQANLRIIDAIAERLSVPPERVFVNLQKYGNTSAAAVAIALDEANRSGAIKRGEHVVMVVFGAGLTWAAAAVRW